MKFVFASLAPLPFLPLTAIADITLTIEQVGSDVVMSYDGSLASFTDENDLSFDLGVVNSTTFLSLNGLQDRFNTGVTKQSGLWTSQSTVGGISSGDSLNFNGDNIDVTRGYTAGSEISGTLTFAGKTVSDMGFTVGDSGVFSGGGNTINFAVSSASVSAIPEPSSMLSLAGLITGSAFLRRRKRA